MAKLSPKKEITFSPDDVVRRIRAWSMMDSIFDLDNEYVIMCWFSVPDANTHAMHRNLGSVMFYSISDGNQMAVRLTDRHVQLLPDNDLSKIRKYIKKTFKFDPPTEGGDERHFYVSERLTFAAVAKFGSTSWTDLVTDEPIPSTRWPQYIRDICCAKYPSLLRKMGFDVDLQLRIDAIEHFDRLEPIDEALVRRLIGTRKLTEAVRQWVRDIAKRHAYPCAI